MTRSAFRLFQIVAALLSLTACIERTSALPVPAPTSPNTPPQDEDVRVRVTPSPLPAAGGFPATSYSADESPPPRPGLCEWVDGADVVVWGKLVDLRLNLFPAARPTHEPPLHFEWMEEGCADSTSWAPSLELTVQVETAIKGDPPTTFIAYAPPYRASSLLPQPVLSDDGVLTWQGDSDVGQAFVIGQTIGLAAYYFDEYQVFSVLFEPFFGQDEWGQIVFAPESEFESWNFPRPPLEGVWGETPSDVALAAKQCSGNSPGGLARLEAAHYVPDGSVTSPWVFAASCTPSLDYYQQPQNPAVVCTSLQDCQQGELCICPDESSQCACECVSEECAQE
jgi:hypothetical protein